MQVDILCPGPSLASHLPALRERDAYPIVIGVNRAATAFACDCWACGDYGLVCNVRDAVIGTPTLFTTANGDSQLRDHYGAWRGRTVLWESLYDLLPPERQWPLFSLTAAIVYAAKWLAGPALTARPPDRDPDSIDLYGVDWAGTADWDGTQAGGNRSDERWRLERSIVENVLTPWLKDRGVEVKRHEPQQPANP